MSLQKIKSFLNYCQVFRTPNDIVKFRNVYNNKTNNHLVSIRVKETKDHPIFCRPNTTDAQVLWDTFYRKYHIPTIPLKENSIIMDLGSNAGYTMAHFAYLYPKSKIYGVEMDFENFLLAQRNIGSLKGQCKIVHAAVWSEDGQINYVGDDAWGFHVNDSKSDNMKSAPAKTLDTIFAEFNIKQVDYLKVDIEGAEKTILENPGAWIHQIKHLKIEVHPPATIGWCFDILKQFGFECSKDDKHPSAIIANKH